MTGQPVRVLTNILAAFLLVFGLMFSCLVSAETATKKKSATKQNPKILILHSYHPGKKWTKSISLGISYRFKHSIFANAEISTDYMDTKRNPGSEYLKKLADIYRHKYPASRKFDLIITVDDRAFYFLLDQGSSLFPDTPIVFCGINYYVPEIIKRSPRHITGVLEQVPAMETVVAAKRIHPKRNKVYIICDNKLLTSRAILQDVGKQLAHLKDSLAIHYLCNLSLSSLLQKVKDLKQDSFILLLTFNQDAKGNFTSSDTVLEQICEVSPVPIYTVYGIFSGRGVVGGRMIEGKEQGKAAADLAIQILQGKDPRDIPVVSQIPTTFQFDWNRLQKYKFNKNNLPPNSIIIHRPVHEYPKFLKWLPLIILVVLVQFGFIIALLFISRRESRIREELSQSERKWRSLTENLPDIIFRIDRQGHYQYINSAVERSFKIKAEDFIGKTARQLKLPESMHDPESNEILAVFRDGKMRTRVEEVNTANGLMILESRFAPEHDESGNIIHVLGISRDVTEQKQAIRELSLRQFILENSHLAIIILRADGAVYFSNKTAEDLLGYTHKELETTNIDQLKLWRKKITINKLLPTLRDELFRRSETIYTSPDNSETPMEITLNYMSVGSEEYICMFLNDITRRRKHEEELRHAKELAEQSDQLKSTFLANMSHEVRTPLNGILGFAELLKYSDAEKEETQKYIDIIYESGNTLLKIIDDILDISKIEAGQIKIVKSSFSLNRLIEELFMLFEHKILSSDGKIKLKLARNESQPEYVIHSDEVRLRQILTNLIGNALKFTSEGYVEIGLKNQAGHIVVYVKDTGIGIPEEKQKIIFDPFRQAEDSISRTYGGTGLGLAIVQSYAKLLHSEVFLKSTVGKGSTFYVKLPLDIQSKPVEKKVEKTVQTYNWEGKKILVVEDDRTSFLFLNKLLTQTNADILHVESGQRAIESCQNNQDIDIVLMDVRLPDLNGLEATRNIKSLRPNLPIVIETANALSADKEESKQSGCDGFLTKPINKEELLSTLQKLLYPDSQSEKSE